MFDDTNAMVKVYGYTKGCEACDKLKDLLWRHNITFTFIPVGKIGSGCAHRKWVVSQGHDTVPQVWMDSTYIGNYGTIKNHLEPGGKSHEPHPIIGWLPETYQRMQTPSKAPMRVETMETQEASARKIKEVVEEEGKAEACYINPLTGQKECS